MPHCFYCHTVITNHTRILKGTYFGGCDQVLNKLREDEVLFSQGATIGETSRKIGVTEQTYYRWRKEYGGMRLEQASAMCADKFHYKIFISSSNSLNS